jgi:hypothetical protein
MIGFIGIGRDELQNIFDPRERIDKLPYPPLRIDLHQLSEAEGLARAADVPVAVEHTVVIVSRGAVSIGTKRKLGYKLATEKPEPILNEQAAAKAAVMFD